MKKIVCVMNIINQSLDNIDDSNIYLDELMHSYGVAYISATLALKRNLDCELAYIIGILHDYARISKNILNENHSKIGAKDVFNLLKKINLFTEDELKIIYNSIYNHSEKDKVHSKYDEILKDADVLERKIYLSKIEDYSGMKKIRYKKTLNEVVG